MFYLVTQIFGLLLLSSLFFVIFGYWLKHSFFSGEEQGLPHANSDLIHDSRFVKLMAHMEKRFLDSSENDREKLVKILGQKINEITQQIKSTNSKPNQATKELALDGLKEELKEWQNLFNNRIDELEETLMDISEQSQEAGSPIDTKVIYNIQDSVNNMRKRLVSYEERYQEMFDQKFRAFVKDQKKNLQELLEKVQEIGDQNQFFSSREEMENFFKNIERSLSLSYEKLVKVNKAISDDQHLEKDLHQEYFNKWDENFQRLERTTRDLKKIQDRPVERTYVQPQVRPQVNNLTQNSSPIITPPPTWVTEATTPSSPSPTPPRRNKGNGRNTTKKSEHSFYPNVFSLKEFRKHKKLMKSKVKMQPFFGAFDPRKLTLIRGIGPRVQDYLKKKCHIENIQDLAEQNSKGIQNLQELFYGPENGLSWKKDALSLMRDPKGYMEDMNKRQKNAFLDPKLKKQYADSELNMVEDMNPERIHVLNQYFGIISLKGLTEVWKKKNVAINDQFGVPRTQLINWRVRAKKAQRLYLQERIDEKNKDLGKSTKKKKARGRPPKKAKKVNRVRAA